MPVFRSRPWKTALPVVGRGGGEGLRGDAVFSQSLCFRHLLPGVGRLQVAGVGIDRDFAGLVFPIEAGVLFVGVDDLPPGGLKHGRTQVARGLDGVDDRG